MELPRNHIQLLTLARERIASGDNAFLCHAITAVGADAVRQIHEDCALFGEVTANWIITMAAELYHEVQQALNAKPVDGLIIVGVFDHAYDAAHPESKDEMSHLDYRQARLDWIDRSLWRADDTGEVKNIRIPF